MSESGGRRAVLCLVTPGAALPASGDRADALVALIEEAANSGIDLVQVREPDLPARLLSDIVSRGVAATRGTRTRIVVNDRVDVALAASADGAHLGARSLPPARVRQMAPAGFVIGRSIHGLDEAIAAADSADYLVAGTVFRTTSKPEGTRLLGIDGLAVIARAVRVPVLAIGGIDLDNVAQVARSGAAGIAAIGLFATAFAGSRLRQTAERVRGAFDTAGVIP